MRRLPASMWLGGLLMLWLLGAMLALATAGTPLGSRVLSPLSCLGSVSGVRAIGDWLVRSAHAEDELKFKPVPRESLSRFERLRVVKRESSARSGTVAEAPEAPEVPEVPEEPATPEVVIGKSGSVMRIGSDIHVAANEVVKGDLSSMGGDIEIEGHVQGDVVAMRGDVRLHSNARVDGDVVCIGGTLTEDPGAHVGGQRVTAIGDKHRGHDRDSDSHFSSDDDRPRRRSGRGHHVSYALTWLIILLALAWLYTRFAPGSTASAVEVGRSRPALAFGIGSVMWALLIPSVVALALIIALLCITIIGIPLALAAIVGYVLFIALVCSWGYVVGASLLGARLAQPGWFLAKPSALMPPGLAGNAVRGVLAVSGAAVVGQILRWLGPGTPIAALGMMIWIVAIVASAALTTLGAGAWLNAEFTTGTLGRWWSGRRGRFGGLGGPPPGTPPGTPDGGGSPPAPAPLVPPPLGESMTVSQTPYTPAPYTPAPRQSGSFGATPDDASRQPSGSDMPAGSSPPSPAQEPPSTT